MNLLEVPFDVILASYHWALLIAPKRAASALVGLTMLVACSGCLIVPKTTTTRSTVDSRVVTNRLPGDVAIRARAHLNLVVVDAERRDECVEETVEVQEVKRKRGPDLAVPDLGGGGDGTGALIVLMAAPVTLAASGIITAIVLAAGDDESVTLEEGPVSVQRWSCPAPLSEVKVELAVASGQRFTGVTDERGTVTFEFPGPAPRRGRISARGDQWSRQFVYQPNRKVALDKGPPPDRAATARESARLSSIQDSCDPLIREWRAQTDPEKAGRLILKMPDRCRDPEVLQFKRSAARSAATGRETL